MSHDNLSDKQAIHKSTANSFLRFYNEHYGSRYKIINLQASCVRCADESRLSSLNLEICVVDELPDEARRTADSRFTPGGPLGTGAPSIRNDPAERIIERLRDQLNTRQHTDTALVMRQSSPIWSRDEWAEHASQIPWTRIGFQADTFDRGIWALCIKAERALPPGGIFEDAEDFLRIDPYRPRAYRAREPLPHRRPDLTS